MWYKPVTVTNELGPLKTWSFSGLKDYEQCAFKRFLSKVGGFRQEAGPQAKRGVEYHNQIESFIRGESSTLPKIHAVARSIIDQARDRYSEGNIILEQNWYIDRDWNTCTEHDDWWAIFIIDFFESESKTSAIIRDWKTGKSRNNELKHAEQLMLYAIAAFERFPDLQHAQVSCVYVDEGHESLTRSYTREGLAPIKKQFDKRANNMTTAKTFTPNPSSYNCRWCDYKTMLDEKSGRPLCEYGV